MIVIMIQYNHPIGDDTSIGDYWMIIDAYRGFYYPIVIGDYNHPRTKNPKKTTRRNGMIEGCSALLVGLWKMAMMGQHRWAHGTFFEYLCLRFGTSIY